MTPQEQAKVTRPGFKLTKLGWLPEEWEVVQLKNVTLKVQDGTHFSPEISDEGTYKYITSKNIRPGTLKLDTVEYITREEHEKIYARCDAREGDILLTKDGASTGNACLNTLDEEISLLSSVAFIRSNPDRASNIFLYQFIVSPRGQAMITGSMAGQAITRITLTKLRNFNFPLPPLPEQTRIATCLATWDRAITTTRHLLEQLETRKTGLMQRLLTGEVRLPGFEGEWEEYKVGDFLTESRLSGSNGLEAEKLTVKLWGKGVRRKIDKQSGSVNTNYFKRKAGQLIYSKLDFLNCAFAIIPDKLDGLESTLDLPTFDFSDQVAPKFILERIKQKSFYEKYGERANGSRKARRIHPDMFLSFPILLPPLKEQTAIATVLTTADREITLYRHKLTTLETQKRGLMQQLLTGQKRLSA